MENFDYEASLERLEAIALKVEDPQTGIEDIDALIKESNTIVQQCRDYLREAKDKLCLLYTSPSPRDS